MTDLKIEDMPVWDGEHACWLVKKTENYRVEIYQMIYNFRVVVSDLDNYLWWIQGWCYFGTDPEVFLKAIKAAREWDPESEPAPQGFDRALA